jgi:hypothetical protein
MWDKVELYARILRHPFIVITIGVFIARNLSSFIGKPSFWLFVIGGLLWALSAIYLGIV